MLITYRPEGGEPRDWEFLPRHLSSTEAEDVEDATGWAFPSFQAQFYAGRTRARRAVLWVLLRREDPALRFNDVEYRMTELGFHWEGGDEASELRRQVEIDPDIDEDTRVRLLEQLAPDETPEEPGDDETVPKGSGTEPGDAATSG